MKANLKLVLGLFLLSDVVIGFGAYQINQNAKDVEADVNAKVLEINKSLPGLLVGDNVYKKGYFDSTGEYTFKLKDAATSNSKIIFKYKLSHGVSTLFSKNVGLNSTVEFAGDIAKIIKPVEDKLFVITGSINKEGLSDYSIKSGGLIISDEKNPTAKVEVSSSSGVLKYNKETKDYESNYKIDTVKVSTPVKEMSVDISGVGYDIKGNNNLGSGSFFVQDAKSIRGSLSGLKISYDANMSNNKYNYSTGISIASIDAGMGQKGSLNLAYSLKGLQKEQVDYFIKKYQDLKSKSGQELTPADLNMGQKDKEEFLKLISNGLSIGLDNIEIKSNSGNIKLSTKAEVSPVKSVDKISFEDNTKISFNVVASGQMIDSFIAMPSTALGQDIKKYNDGSYKVSAEYKNSVFTVDGLVNNKVGITIRQSLRNLDLALGIDNHLPPLSPEVPVESTLSVPSDEASMANMAAEQAAFEGANIK